jgi:hypothetical protein
MWLTSLSEECLFSGYSCFDKVHGHKQKMHAIRCIVSCEILSYSRTVHPGNPWTYLKKGGPIQTPEVEAANGAGKRDS